MWQLKIMDMDYLDGIRCGLMVAKSDNGAPVAYMFDVEAARLATAAPELLEALRETKEILRFALLSTTPQIAKDAMVFVRQADAAIAKATGQ